MEHNWILLPIIAHIFLVVVLYIVLALRKSAAINLIPGKTLVAVTRSLPIPHTSKLARTNVRITSAPIKP